MKRLACFITCVIAVMVIYFFATGQAQSSTMTTIYTYEGRWRITASLLTWFIAFLSPSYFIYRVWKKRKSVYIAMLQSAALLVFIPPALGIFVHATVINPIYESLQERYVQSCEKNNKGCNVRYYLER
ncbi:MAG: hypothetical protein HND56_09815 [Pseudomonadota bacterium]|nr:MAG: hypothetical protein HND56_09815 [Pseudomonadota bacterium]